MNTTDLDVASRRPLDDTVEAYSSAILERVALRDGRRVIFKTLPAEGDWLTRVSGGTDRARRLWESGLLDRMSAVVDHTVIGVCEIDGHDVVVMRDVTPDLVPPRGPVSRLDSQRLLAGLAAFHEAGRREPVQELCPIGARYGMFAPALLRADPGPNAHPSTAWILPGWDLFAESADPDVLAAVDAVHEDPHLVGRPLSELETTVVHGDVKLNNLGFGSSGLVAIDWGDLTGFGPPEVDVAWFAVMNAHRIGGSPSDVFDDYEAAAGRALDQDALDHACIGSLAQMGFRMAGLAVIAERPEERAASAAELDWWTDRVRTALDRTGLV